MPPGAVKPAGGVELCWALFGWPFGLVVGGLDSGFKDVFCGVPVWAALKPQIRQ